MAEDYVSKWFKVIATPKSDGKIVIQFPKKNKVFVIIKSFKG